MARKDETVNSGILNREIGSLNIAAKKLISSVDTSFSEKELLSSKDAQIQKIISEELDLVKGISKGSIIDFVTKMSQSSASSYGKDPASIDNFSLFSEDISNLFGYYQELYKNRYIELTDLKFITKFIPAIGEAVKTTLDSIVSSDDFSSSITRNLILPKSLTDEEKGTVESEIERIERDEKLLKKLKNIVYKNTLITGNYYIYHIPYNELFNEYEQLVKDGRIVNNMLVTRANASRTIAQNNAKNKTKIKSVFENDNSYIDKVTYTLESLSKSFSKEDYKEKEITEITKVIKNDLSYIATVDCNVLLEALEGYTSAEIMKKNMSSYREIFGGNGILSEENNVYAEGSVSDSEASKKYSTTGSYIKYIDANKLVPINIYNQTIGYLHVHDMTATQKSSAMRTMSETSYTGATSNMFSSTSLANDTRNKATQNIVDSITEGILANFSNKFVNNNPEFKRLIADCIVANGLTNTAYQIQFIPANYITVFAVNEDENGIGKSILQDSLFPSKLLLSLIISKMLLYMNKSGNKTIAYVRKGPIDVSTGNHVQQVIRMMQEGDITFSDLLSTNLAFSKLNRYGGLQIPMARNGDRLVDFEVQEGQQVDMHTDFEDWLEKLAILGTGVPSVILEYTDAADYAKSLVTANIKFAGRIASLDADLEEPTTELYKALLETSNLTDDLKNKVINQFEFKLCRPRVLTNANLADYLSQMQTIAETLANMFVTNSDDADNDKIKALFIKNLTMSMLPFLSWDDFKQIYEKSKLEVIGDKDLDKDKNKDESNLSDLGDSLDEGEEI